MCSQEMKRVPKTRSETWAAASAVMATGAERSGACLWSGTLLSRTCGLRGGTKTVTLGGEVRWRGPWWSDSGHMLGLHDAVSVSGARGQMMAAGVGRGPEVLGARHIFSVSGVGMASRVQKNDKLHPIAYFYLMSVIQPHSCNHHS